jgi:hypothetical protein
MSSMQTTLLHFFRRIGLWAIVLVLGLLLFYYIVLGLAIYQRIDDNPDFAATKEPVAGGSNAVNMAIALIDREVNEHMWVANTPWFAPGAWLTRTPAYQQGIIYAISRFTMSLGDQLARTRGSSAIDPDIDRATGYLRYAGDVWIFNFKTSVLPTAPSEQQYRSGKKALEAFNKRLAAGQATFDKRADNLQATLQNIAADLGSQSALEIEQVEKHGGEWLEFRSNNVYFTVKGRLYGYYMILRELGKDYEAVIRENGAENVWNNMLETFKEAALMEPLIIFNGKGDSQFLPCHVCGQGFWLVRARTQLYEVSNILLK